MMRFLVTGGCGFIGSHLVKALVQAGHVVRILDNLSSSTMSYRPTLGEMVYGDVSDITTVAHALENIDGCFHLATASAQAMFAASANCRKPVPIVYASSAAVYGNNPDIISETEPVMSLSPNMCETHGAFASQRGVPNCGMRFFHVYGPRRSSGVVSVFGRQINNGQAISINGDGYHSRDFIYVGDVIRALRLTMDHCFNIGANSDVFNVCTGIDTNIIDLADEIAILLRKDLKFRFCPALSNEPRRLVGNPIKMRRIIGFKAETDLISGLAATLNVQHAFA